MVHSFDTGIAKEVGVNEAIFINHLFFWIKKNVANEKHFHDGRWWTYNSLKAFCSLFEYFTIEQIRDIIGKLIRKEIITKGNYNKNPFDRTAWYAFTDTGVSMLKKYGYELLGDDLGNNENAFGKNPKSDLGKIPNDININNNYNNIETDIKTNIKEKKENIKRKEETPQDDNFEKCWEVYRRKGSKKKAREYWNKLSDEEKALVLPHVKVYASTREVKFQKDFERYLRDKIFNEVVYNGNTMMYDPQMYIGEEYRPAGINIFRKDGKNWTFANSLNMIDDGYTDEDRPDGAELTLHNDRGTIRWKAAQRRWVHI